MMDRRLSQPSSELGQISFDASIARQQEQAKTILQNHKEVEDKIKAHQVQLQEIETKDDELQKKRFELLKDKRKGLLIDRYKKTISEGLVPAAPTETSPASSDSTEDPLVATDSEIAKLDAEKTKLKAELTQLTTQKELLYQQAEQLTQKILDQERYRGPVANIKKGKLPFAKVEEPEKEFHIEPASPLLSSATVKPEATVSPVVAGVAAPKDIAETVEQPKKVFSVDIDIRASFPPAVMGIPFNEDSVLYKKINEPNTSGFLKIDNSEIDIKAKAGAGSLVYLCEKRPEQDWNIILKQEYIDTLPDELKKSNRISIKVGTETLSTENKTAKQSRQKEVGSKILDSIDGVVAPISVVHTELVADIRSGKSIDAFVELTEYVPRTGYQVLQEKNPQSAQLFDQLDSASYLLDKLNLTVPISANAVDFSKLTATEYNRLVVLREKLAAIDMPAKKILVDLIKQYLRAYQPLRRLSKETPTEGFDLESDVFNFQGSTKQVPDFLYRDDGTLVRIDQSVVVPESFTDSELETVILPYMEKMQEGIAWNESNYQWESPAGTLPGADTFSKISLALLEDASWLPAEKRNEDEARNAEDAKGRAAEATPVSYDQLSLADKKYFDSTEVLSVFKSEGPILVQFLSRKEKKQVEGEEIHFHTFSVTTTESGEIKTRYVLAATEFSNLSGSQDAALRKKGFSDKLNEQYINAFCKDFSSLEEAQNYLKVEGP